ncbi:MAG: carboxylesterase/lipase family protein [Myxococcota bacterium]|nr:carboxylesterase/lipase family protein [Myxococcota bacterium]
MATIVETRRGRLEGEEIDGVRVFRGIPYARPPVGPLRFRPPLAPEPWAGVRDATRFGPAAPQPEMLMPIPGFDVGEQSEDCLYLNVYAPAASGGGRPVLVWIHGGGFVIGSGSQNIYDASSLVRRGDVVVVTINYRLGALGFLHLDDEESSANLGLLDQIAALEWVRDEIAGFGGDPGNVTIFGESAGGMSVGTLLGCPAARGLFHRAVAQSGAGHAVHDEEGAAATSEALLRGLGLSAREAHRLRELPMERIRDIQRQIQLELMTRPGASSLLPFQPMVDGEVLTHHPVEAVRGGNARDVTLMIGTTRDEWRLFNAFDPGSRGLDEAALAARIESRLPGVDGAAFVRAYREAAPDADWAALYSAFETDRVFRIPAIRLAEAALEHHDRVYKYLFSWEAPAFGGVLGACHAVELPFLFDLLDQQGAEMFIGAGPDARALADHTMDAWLSFARDGDPGHEGLPDWPAYCTERRATMEFGPSCRVLDDPGAALRDLWDGVL